MTTQQFPRTWVVVSSRTMCVKMRSLPSFRTLSNDHGADDRSPVVLVDDACTVLKAEDGRGHSAVLIGQSDCRVDDLELTLGAEGESAGAEGLLNSAAGAYHHIAMSPGRLSILATTAGVLQTYYAHFQGGILASNSAVLLGYLIGKCKVNLDSLGGYLFETPPNAVAQQALLQDIHPVPVGAQLRVFRGQAVDIKPLWNPWIDGPRDYTSAAAQVREELTTATLARMNGAASVGCDLSGGFDSTSLAFIASAGPAALRLYTLDGTEDVSADRYWSRLAASKLNGAAHRAFSPDDYPGLIDDLDDYIVPLDRPYFAHAGAARALYIPDLSRRDGARIHLTGHGGDHLFTGNPALVHDTMSANPFTAWGQCSSVTQRLNWRWRDVAAALADRRSYEQWWLDQRHNLFAAPTGPRALFGWAMPCRLPSWITPLGIELAQDALVHTAKATPLAETRGKSAYYETILAAGRMMNTVAQLASHKGVAAPHAPFLDLRVVAAASSAPPTQSMTGRAYKPLLRDAMKGVVATDLLSRMSKDDASVDAESGLVRNRQWLVDLWETSRLGELGLIDAPLLAKLCSEPSSPELADCSLYTSLGCELWLRGLEGIAT